VIVTLPYPPSVNKSFVTVHIGRTQRVIKSQAAREYRDVAQRELLAQGARPLKGPVRLSIKSYRPRNAGDIDNGLKAILDACTGFLYVDDAQVYRLEIERFTDKHNPRVEVEISQD
jgi:Holliday junction resolvase RusA-like endonuclease